MLTLLLKSNKDLVNTTPNVRVYQGESYADALQIIIPSTYEEHDLSKFDLTLEYVDPVNVAHAEQMIKDEEPYKEGYIRFTLPLDSDFTKAAGKVKIKIDLVYLDMETSTGYVIHSNEYDGLEILTWDDYFAYTPAEQIGTIDARILELQNEIARLKSLADEIGRDTPDDLMLDEDILHLSKDGRLLGNGIEVLLPGDPDHEDDAHDGVIDLDNLNGFQFMEL